MFEFTQVELWAIVATVIGCLYIPGLEVARKAVANDVWKLNLGGGTGPLVWLASPIAVPCYLAWWLTNNGVEQKPKPMNTTEYHLARQDYADLKNEMQQRSNAAIEQGNILVKRLDEWEGRNTLRADLNVLKCEVVPHLEQRIQAISDVDLAQIQDLKKQVDELLPLTSKQVVHSEGSFDYQNACIELERETTKIWEHMSNRLSDHASVHIELDKRLKELATEVKIYTNGFTNRITKLEKQPCQLHLAKRLSEVEEALCIDNMGTMGVTEPTLKERVKVLEDDCLLVTYFEKFQETIRERVTKLEHFSPTDFTYRLGKLSTVVMENNERLQKVETRIVDAAIATAVKERLDAN